MTPWQAILLVAAISLVTLAGVLWLRSRVDRASAGLPSGQVVYADTEQWRASPPLYSARLGLRGKPDYVVKIGADLIPIEVKPGRRSLEPYEADIMQLAAYCLLVEETSGRRPPYGLLRSREQTFRLPYNAALRERLLATLDNMRADLAARDVPRSHDDPTRCRFCGYAAQCNERLSDGD